jgi:hypothetical protein
MATADDSECELSEHVPLLSSGGSRLAYAGKARRPPKTRRNHNLQLERAAEPYEAR